MEPVRLIDCPEQMIAVFRRFGVIPFFKGKVPGWSNEELTVPGCWFTESEDGGTLGPWDWKIDCVREGGIAYRKFLGGKVAFATVEYYRHLMNWRRSLPKYRMALGERYKATTNSERLMQIELFASAKDGSAEAPFWAKMFDDSSTDLSVDCTPRESLDFLQTKLPGII